MAGLVVHHLNCGSMCPYGRKLLSGQGGFAEQGLLVCHCLLVETESGLVLVDTGFGLDDVTDPRSRIGPFTYLGRPRCDPLETARCRIETMGFSPDDVRHIVLTHLDLDHAGGLPDFPQAKVHLLREASQHPTGSEQIRYRPVHWAHGPDWALYDPGGGEPWHGFEAVRDLDDLPPEILLVPLRGHSRGHTGVAIDSEGGWLLHCGDAYFFHGEMDPEAPWCPPGLRLFQTVAQVDGVQRRWNQRRLRALVREHGHEVRVLSAHDETELRSFGATP